MAYRNDDSDNIPFRPEDTGQHISLFERRKMEQGGKTPARVKPVPPQIPLPLPPQVHGLPLAPLQYKMYSWKCAHVNYGYEQFWGMRVNWLTTPENIEEIDPHVCWPWDGSQPCCEYADWHEFECACRCVQDPIPPDPPPGHPTPDPNCDKIGHEDCTQYGENWDWGIPTWATGEDRYCQCYDTHQEDQRGVLYEYTVPYCNFYDAAWYNSWEQSQSNYFCGQGYGEKCCWWFDMGGCDPENQQNTCGYKCNQFCNILTEQKVRMYPEYDAFGPPAPWHGWAPSGPGNTSDIPGCTVNGDCRHCIDTIPNDGWCDTASTWCKIY